MFLLFILVVVIIILLFLFEKDKINVLKKLFITFIISGSFIFIFGLLFKLFISFSVNSINISGVINIIFREFVIISIIFYVCGIISYIGYFLLKKSI